MNIVVRSIVRQHGWTPDVIDNLKLHERDHHGLWFWYNDVIEAEKEVEAEMKKIKS